MITEERRHTASNNRYTNSWTIIKENKKMSKILAGSVHLDSMGYDEQSIFWKAIIQFSKHLDNT